MLVEGRYVMVAYRNTVEFIALNDKPQEINFERINSYLTVELASEYYKVSTEEIAEDVMKVRSYLLCTNKKQKK